MSTIRMLFVAAAGLFAVVPGLATLREGFFAPPGYEGLFSGLTVAVGSFVLLALAIRRSWIAARSRRRLMLVSAGLMALVVVMAVFYIWARSRTIVPVEWQSDTDPTVVETRYAFLPLVPKEDGTIAEQLAAYGGNRHELAAARFSNIKRWIGAEPIWQTIAILLVLQIIVCSGITLSFGLLGFSGEDAP